jgi:hypothetical protein
MLTDKENRDFGGWEPCGEVIDKDFNKEAALSPPHTVEEAISSVVS